MSFEGVVVGKINNFAGESNVNEDNQFILIYSLALGDLPEGVAHYEPHRLLSIEDAEALGFDAAFDANEEVLVYQTIADFFAYAPGAVLTLIMSPVDSPSNIMAQAEIVAAINETKDGTVIGIAGTVETAVELADEVEVVQAEIAKLALSHRLIDAVILQGNNGIDEGEIELAWEIGELPDMREKNAPNVSISIAQDPAVAAIEGYELLADVGSVIGMLAVRKISENLGSVDIERKPTAYRADANYTLTRGNRWKTAQLSNGVKFEALTPAQRKALTDKGYIYAGEYAGYAGVFLNGSPTCVTATSDYAWIENNRVWNKAARVIRRTLLPKVKSKFKRDPQTGFVRSTTLSYWQGLVESALETMVSSDDISGYSVIIPAAQNPTNATPLQVQAVVVKDGIVHEFSVDVSLV
ncbi:MAG: DUF2586 family protein [Bacteroidetes bacterium]|nr:DUF2586 family protein [Bacteroidota bacterium]